MHETNHGATTDANGHRSIGDLTKQLSRDATELIRAELDLAKLEVSAKAKRSAMGAALLAGAAVFVLVVVGSLAAAAIAALSTAVATWLAALIVAGAALAIMLVLAMVGVSRLRAGTPPVPENAVESVKEDVQWVKTRAKSGLG
jgi:uncharacterized membrane protein